MNLAIDSKLNKKVMHVKRRN